MRKTVLFLLTLALLVTLCACGSRADTQGVPAHQAAVIVGGRGYAPAELSYYYANQYYNFINRFGDYAESCGLEGESGPTGLGEKDCPLLEDGTWRDYFLQLSFSELGEIAGLCAYAKENGVALTEEETAAVGEELASLTTYAVLYGFDSVDAFLSDRFGPGVTEQIVRQARLDSRLAAKAYYVFEEGLDLSDEDLAKERTDEWLAEITQEVVPGPLLDEVW